MNAPLAGAHMLRGARRGMTLVEVVIAATLLTFVVGSSLSALVAGMGHIGHARMVTLAGQITQSAMEQLRLDSYAVIDGYAAQSQPVSLDGVISSDNFASGFTVNMHIDAHFTVQVASSPGVLGKTIAVITTTWPENGVVYSRKTVTTFTEKGLSDYIYAGWSHL